MELENICEEIEKFRGFKKNWDGYGAESFHGRVLNNALIYAGYISSF
ncbi:hypothetical protein J4205_04055 [Candidatus Pacearchaeota archaeon]|nr:hypothetical protein [Candidatus Pacearchaeota archaeon]